MGINRDKLVSIRKRLHESVKANQAALHTIDDILGEGNSSQVSQVSQSTEQQKSSEKIVSSTGVEFPAIVEAQSLAELVTSKQLGMIRALGREVSVNVEFECMGLIKTSTDKLNKLAASAFIQHLQNLQRD